MPLSTGRKLLSAGADVLQRATPLRGFDAYVVGFHPAKDDPAMQMEAHHFCRQVNDDLIQCVLFDGNRDANLIGVEYIISERLHATLPEEEQAYWHPHNYEILSGTLIAPGLPAVAEKALMRVLLNSYGKTWHTWHTGRHDRPGEADQVPLGDPTLMWSFNGDGQMDPSLVQDRDENMALDSTARRKERADLAADTHPQTGVDLPDPFFPDARERPAGVEDADRGADLP